MKQKNYNKSLIGGSIAFILATSCCWLPAILIAIGSGGAVMTFADQLGSWSLYFFIIAAALLILGSYQYVYGNRKKIVSQSTITCPNCRYKKEETMPTNACQYFYECEKCQKVIKPKQGDCCVYCSYGTVPCPPIQENKSCC